MSDVPDGVEDTSIVVDGELLNRESLVDGGVLSNVPLDFDESVEIVDNILSENGVIEAGVPPARVLRMPIHPARAHRGGIIPENPDRPQLRNQTRDGQPIIYTINSVSGPVDISNRRNNRLGEPIILGADPYMMHETFSRRRDMHPQDVALDWLQDNGALGINDVDLSEALKQPHTANLSDELQDILNKFKLPGEFMDYFVDKHKNY